MWVERLNSQRHNVSATVSITAAGLIWFLTQSIVGKPLLISHEPLELTLLTTEKTPEPVAKNPTETPPKLIEKKTIQTPAAVNPPPEVKSVAPNVSTPSAPTNLESAKSESPRTPLTAPAQSAPPVPAVEPIRPPPPPSSVSIESGFVASVRAQLIASKRYPTGREASLQRPSGKVVVWFVLNRNGSLSDAGVEDSSNSIILDNAALATVRRASYANWPEGSWPGQSQHRFTVTLDFAPAN